MNHLKTALGRQCTLVVAYLEGVLAWVCKFVIEDLQKHCAWLLGLYRRRNPLGHDWQASVVEAFVCEIIPTNGLALDNLAVYHRSSYFEQRCQDVRMKEGHHIYDMRCATLYAPQKVPGHGSVWVFNQMEHYFRIRSGVHSTGAVLHAPMNYDL